VCDVVWYFVVDTLISEMFAFLFCFALDAYNFVSRLFVRCHGNNISVHRLCISLECPACACKALGHSENQKRNMKIQNLISLCTVRERKSFKSALCLLSLDEWPPSDISAWCDLKCKVLYPPSDLIEV
jgi:hypothetical protein